MRERFGMSMEMLSIRKDGIKKILLIVLAIMIIANVLALFTDYRTAKKNEQ